MVALWSRILLLAELAVFSLAAAALAPRFGWSIAVAAAVGLFLLLHVLGVLFSLLVSRRYRAEHVNVPPLSARLLREWLAFMAVFVVIQPFERWWMGDDPVDGEADRLPVLLVHGYLCNRGAWWWMRRRLRAAGLRVATVNLEPPLGGIDDLARGIEARLARLREETGAERAVLVAHSMGGLVARAYLRRYGADRVAQLITLGTPHHGTDLAHYGFGRNAHEMRPDSSWLHALNAATPGTPVVSAWSPADNFILPPDSSRLAGAEEVILPPLTHLAMGFSEDVARLVIAEAGRQR